MKHFYVILILSLFSWNLVFAQQNILLEDFESGHLTFTDSITLMGKARWEISNNPVKDKTNSSKRVYRFERLEKTPEWAGFWASLNGKIKSIDALEYQYIHIKYLRTNENSRLRIKLEKEKGNASEFFSINYPEKINEWEWMTFDLKKNDCTGKYSVLSIQPDVAANEPIGTIAYVDDILLSNDPTPYLSFSQKKAQDLTLENKHSTSLQISWAPVFGASSYTVLNRGTEVGQTRGTVILLSGLNPDSQQNLQVIASNFQKEKTQPSQMLSVRTLKRGELEIPGKLHFTERDSNSISLEWNPVLQADSYDVYKNGELLQTIPQTKIKITGLDSHKPFVFTIHARNDQGDKSRASKLTVATLETDLQRENRMSWWHQDKFGMFIHWGVYAAFAGCYENDCIPAGEYGEWIMSKLEIPVIPYREKARTDFSAAKYDPKAWITLAKNAGMKYVVLTSKHHDGFALFDSKASDWNAVQSSAAKRDLVAPLINSAHEAGLKVGLYYSQALDWVNGGSGKHWDKIQDARTFDQYLEEVSLPQVREILKNYGKIDILWWDMPIEMTEERAARFLELLAEEFDWTKDLIINDRLGGSYKFDHNTPEQSIPNIPPTGRDDKRDWETCMTLNSTWGYTKDDHQWKSAEDIIHKLTDIVSKGGNFLLNIGPMANGEIPTPSIALLDTVGQWMKVNSEAVYGTTANPFPEQLPWGRCTKKINETNHFLYFHIWNWPQDGILHIPGMQDLPGNAYLLTNKVKKITVSKGNGELKVMLSKEKPEKYSTTLVFEMNRNK